MTVGPSERILRLRVGEDVPAGHEIVRIIAVEDVPVGTGTATERVYVVAARLAASTRATAVTRAGTVLSEVLDEPANFFVVVPFLTKTGAEWAARDIGALFDCHIIGRADVRDDAVVVATVEAE